MALEFKVGEEAFPQPESYRLGDCELINDLVGLEFSEYARRLEEAVDQKTLVAMFAVAVWQKHPNWRREDVIRFVEQVDMADFEVPSGDDGPPAEPATTPETPSPSPGTSDESTTSPELSEEQDTG